MAASSAFLLAKRDHDHTPQRPRHVARAADDGIFPAIAGFMLLPSGGLTIAETRLHPLHGLVMIPLAFFCWRRGRATFPRRKSACSTCWRPFWRRSGNGSFAETPTNRTLLGGTILILALLGHSFWQMRIKAARARIACVEIAGNRIAPHPPAGGEGFARGIAKRRLYVALRARYRCSGDPSSLEDS